MMMQEDLSRIIYYTSSDEQKCPDGVGNVANCIALNPGNHIVSHSYNGMGKIVAEHPITSLRLQNVPRMVDIWLPTGISNIVNIINSDTSLYTGLYGDLSHIDGITEMTGLMTTQSLTFLSATNIQESGGFGSGGFRGTPISGLRVPVLTAIPNYRWNNHFVSCPNLTLLDIRSVTSIGDDAIVSCPVLDTLILGATIPSVTGTKNFANSPLSNIYVPDNMVNAYKADSYWSQYASKIKGYSAMR